jgi:hypothetical protein
MVHGNLKSLGKDMSSRGPGSGGGGAGGEAAEDEAGMAWPWLPRDLLALQRRYQPYQSNPLLTQRGSAYRCRCPCCRTRCALARGRCCCTVTGGLQQRQGTQRRHSEQLWRRGAASEVILRAICAL